MVNGGVGIIDHTIDTGVIGYMSIDIYKFVRYVDDDRIVKHPHAWKSAALFHVFPVEIVKNIIYSYLAETHGFIVEYADNMSISGIKRQFILEYGDDFSSILVSKNVIIARIDSRSVHSALNLRLVCESFAAAYDPWYVYKHIGGDWGRSKHSAVMRANTRLWWDLLKIYAATSSLIITENRLSQMRWLDCNYNPYTIGMLYCIRTLLSIAPEVIFDNVFICDILELLTGWSHADSCDIAYIKEWRVKDFEENGQYLIASNEKCHLPLQGRMFIGRAIQDSNGNVYTSIPIKQSYYGWAIFPSSDFDGDCMHINVAEPLEFPTNIMDDEIPELVSAFN